METSFYEGLLYYIKGNRQQTPSNIDEKLKREILVKHQNYVVQNGKLYFKPKDKKKLREVIRINELEEILYETHNNAGHFGTQAVYTKLQPDFYWPNMFKKIEEYVKACKTCQFRKKPTPNEPLHPIKVTKPAQVIGLDCVGPLKETPNNNKYIITAVDHFTKWAEAKAVPDIKATTIAKFLFDDIIARHGSPERILTDRGTSFRNELVDSLCEIMGIKHSYTSAYHPQTNGLTEKFNGTLCNILAKLVDERGDHWDAWITTALLCYRNKVQSSTKFTPAFLTYGHNLETPFTLKRQSRQPDETETPITIDDYVELLTDKFKKVYEITQENQDKAHVVQKKAYDKKIKPASYNIGQKVLLYDSAKQNTKGDKFRKIYKGPYYIHEVHKNGTYKLRHCETQEILKDINGKRLKEFIDKPLWEPQVTIEEDVEQIRRLEERIRQDRELHDTGRGRIGDRIRQEAFKEIEQMTKLEKQIKNRMQLRRKTELDKETQMRKLAQEVVKRQDENINKRVKQVQDRIRSGQYLAKDETILVTHLD